MDAYSRLTEYEKAVADIAAHTVRVTIEGTGLPKPLNEHMIDVREAIAKAIYDNREMTFQQIIDEEAPE
jgi:hypothetical protein